MHVVPLRTNGVLLFYQNRTYQRRDLTKRFESKIMPLKYL